MRILHVLDHSVPLHSGYTFRTIGILRAQRRRGWQTLHVTSPKHAQFIKCDADKEDVDGWSFYRTPNGGFAKIPGVAEVTLMRQLARRLEQIVATERVDIIHAHSPLLNGLPALRIGRKHRIPVVYEVRAFWEDAAVDHGVTSYTGLRYQASRKLETLLLKRVGAVATICEGLRQEIIDRGIEPESISVIPNAVDVQSFTGIRVRDEGLAQDLRLSDKIVLGFIGSFYHYEGIDLLLEALSQVVKKRSDVQLLLIGGGPHEIELRRASDQLDLNQHVIFLGRVNHSDIKRYYDLVDVFVYPRRRQRLTDLVTPLKPLEAMATGGIVVASDVGGHRELIADGETGYLFPAGNISALAENLETVLTAKDKGEWARIQFAGRRFVETQRNWDACTAPYESIYRHLLRQKV